MFRIHACVDNTNLGGRMFPALQQVPRLLGIDCLQLVLVHDPRGFRKIRVRGFDPVFVIRLRELHVLAVVKNCFCFRFVDVKIHKNHLVVFDARNIFHLADFSDVAADGFIAHIVSVAYDQLSVCLQRFRTGSTACLRLCCKGRCAHADTHDCG